MTIEPGLVFAIPLAEDTFGFGQLVAWQHPIFYMVGYEMKAECPTVGDHELEQANPIFLGNFFDVLIRNQRWLAVKHVRVPKVAFPCFKVKIGEKFYLESWDRRQTREATSEQCSILPFRTNHGPIILENALKAHYGLHQWEPIFDGLKAETVSKLSQLL